MTLEKALNDFVITSCQVNGKIYRSITDFDYEKYCKKQGKIMVDNKAEGFVFIIDEEE